MNKVKITLLSVVVLLCISCEKSDDSKVEYPACLQSSIDFILRSAPIIPREKIKKYLYNGEEVFLIDTFISDVPAVVVTWDCVTICEFGGVLGGNTCPDFHENAIFIKTVWTDPR